jgi:PAS domain S-box-containing protein
MDDIDSLRKRAAELEKANRELSDVFNAMGNLIFVVDKDNVIVRVNDACASFLKSNPKDIIGRKCYEIMHGLSAPLTNCPMELTKRDGIPHIEEVNDPHIGVPLLVASSPIFVKDHRMVGVVHVAKDISNIKKAEATLRESEIKYKTIFDSSADAIMLLAPEKGFLGCNSATIRLFGCKDEKEFISGSPGDLSPEYQPDGELSSVKSQRMMRLAMEKGSNFFEWTHKRMNGEEFFATVLLTRMELGTEIMLQATVRDITERILSEKRLAKKLRDFEIFYKAAIDREIKMKELKKKIAELEAKVKL